MEIPLANYEEQQQHFLGLLDPRARNHILMFQGESGSGKTRLLESCIRAVPAYIPYLSVQLRGSATTTAHLFYRLGRRVGWARLPAFTRQVAALCGMPHQGGDAAWQLDIRQHLERTLQVEDLSARRQRGNSLTDAWFADAHTFQTPLLLILDTYEDATVEFNQWFSQQFLPWIADSQTVRVLVAGQKVPELSSDWRHCCSYHRLTGVHEAAAWLPVAQAMGRQVHSLDYLAGACAAFRGNPGKILEFIQLLPQTGGAAQPQQTVAQARSQLRRGIEAHFNLGDIRGLCFDLSIRYEDVGGSENLTEKVIALIEYVERHGRLAELTDLCRELRPRVTW